MREVQIGGLFAIHRMNNRQSRGERPIIGRMMMTVFSRSSSKEGHHQKPQMSPPVELIALYQDTSHSLRCRDAQIPTHLFVRYSRFVLDYGYGDKDGADYGYGDNAGE